MLRYHTKLIAGLAKKLESIKEGDGTKNHRTMANLYCTLLHTVGKPRDNFGIADPGLKDLDRTGPVADLLVRAELSKTRCDVCRSPRWDSVSWMG